MSRVGVCTTCALPAQPYLSELNLLLLVTEKCHLAVTEAAVPTCYCGRHVLPMCIILALLTDAAHIAHVPACKVPAAVLAASFRLYGSNE